MLEQGIYNELKNDSTLSNKVKNGTAYHIYPLRVPDNIQFQKAITYTEITQSLVYPLARTSTVQVNCIASKFDDAVDLSADIDRIFNDKAEYTMGGKLYVNYSRFSGRNSYYDPDSKMYIVAVEITIKF